MNIIDGFLEHDKTYLDNVKNNFHQYEFVKTSCVITHRDYSLSNMLIIDTENKHYIIDWDWLKLRPAMMDLQRAITLICSCGKTNPSLDGIRPDRLKTFLNGYWENKNPSLTELEQLVEVQEFISHLYWLEFNLGKILTGDYKVLNVLSNDNNVNLYWIKQNSLKQYKDLLQHLTLCYR